MNKIYIIDESEHYVEMIRIRLLNYGYSDITSFANEAEALDQIRIEPPDLCLVDTRLTPEDGFQICRKIKDLCGSDVKVVLMAGLAETYNVSKAQEARADEYVVKTFDCALLMTAIKKSLFQLQVLKEKI